MFVIVAQIRYSFSLGISGTTLKIEVKLYNRQLIRKRGSRNSFVTFLNVHLIKKC